MNREHLLNYGSRTKREQRLRPKFSFWAILTLALTLLPSLAQSNLVSNIGSTMGSPAEQFEAANRLYEQTNFLTAATAYENILKDGTASPALWFNLGNACFKSGQIGRAIVAYRRAENSTPRDPDVRANLKFARNQVKGPTFHLPKWQAWISRGFSINEWSVVTAIGLWLTFFCLIAAKLRPDLKASWSLSARILGASTLVLMGGLILSLVAHSPEMAVVTANDVTVRNGPLDESANSFAANDGAELRVLDRKDDWLQVTDGTTRRIGWVKRTQVAVP